VYWVLVTALGSTGTGGPIASLYELAILLVAIISSPADGTIMPNTNISQSAPVNTNKCFHASAKTDI